MDYDGYATAVIDQLWSYAEREFSTRPELLENFKRDKIHPLVFKESVNPVDDLIAAISQCRQQCPEFRELNCTQTEFLNHRPIREIR